MRMCHFWAQNGPFILKNFFLVQIIITFIYLLALFIVQNFKKNSYCRSRIMRMRHFWAQSGPFAPNKFFFWKKLLISFLSTYWPLSFYKILKKSSSRSRLMTMRHFWAQNGPFAQMRIFSENLLISLVSFIHAYLHAKMPKIKVRY